jgi:integrase
VARPPTGSIVERRGARGTSFGLRFRAYGKRYYVTAEATTRQEAEVELQNTLADVRRGIWRPPTPTEPEAPKDEQTFHEFASTWFERHRREVEPRTQECWTWALSHVLEHLASLPVSAVTAESVDAYRTAKVEERERLDAELEFWREADPEKRGPRPPCGLGKGSINRTLRTLAVVLDDAVDYGYLAANPARGRGRRLRLGKADRPRRIWLKVEEVRSLLDAAGNHRALLATMILTGVRVSELCSLRWWAVDLARARLTVEESKTEAGEGREVRLVPLLLDELKAWRAARPSARPDDLVFPTRTGTRRDRNNVRSRILLPALARANRARSEAGMPPIQHVTNHTLRRTFASLLYADGATPPEVMAQLGHKSAHLALEVYAKWIAEEEVRPDAGTRMEALVRGVLGTNGHKSLEEAVASSDLATQEAGVPL